MHPRAATTFCTSLKPPRKAGRARQPNGRPSCLPLRSRTGAGGSARTLKGAPRRGRFQEELLPPEAPQGLRPRTPGPPKEQAAIDATPVLSSVGHTVSVDFSNMDESESVGLVNFCVGVTGTSRVWLFRPADGILMLIPHSE
jgi:hypothetical protein